MNYKPICILAFALYFGPFAGISIAEERATATTPISSMPDEDSDVDQEGLPKPDGLSNQDEALVGTDPLNPDSDDDELLDGAEAVPLSDKMKVAAARELRYAVVRLGPMKSALGVNSKGEVLLVDYGGSGTTQAYLWKDGVSQIIGTGLRGSFRGPMEDGTVYFGTPTEETMFTDSFGLAVSFKSKLMAWKNGATTQAGHFYETNFWENRRLPEFPTTHPTTEFLNEDVEAAYTSAWTAMKSAIPPAVPPNFAFSPQGYTSTSSSGGISRINDLGDKTYTFSANFSSPFSGPLGDSYSLPAQIELTGWMSLMPGFSGGEGYWKLNNPPEPNATTNLPRDIMVNNGLRAVGRTNGGVLKWLVPGPNDIPIPNVSDIFDLNNSPNEGPYMLGSDSTGNLLLLCHGGGAFPRISLNGLGTISHDSEAVVSRKISDNLLIPADTGIWRNQRFRPLSEITSYDPNGQDYFTINQVSPTNDFLLGYGYFGDEQLHEGVLLVPADIAVDANRDGEIKIPGIPSGIGPFDKTEESKPFRFWINDDNDGLPNSEGEFVGTESKDYDDGIIQTGRDLEDFSRLHLYVGGFYGKLSNGTIKIGLKWSENATSTPAIKVYKSADLSGSDAYLKSEQAALAQISGPEAETLGEVMGTTPLILPADLFSGHSESNSKACLLFEGSKEGLGQLCVTIYNSEDTEIGKGPSVWIDIKNIKTMYVRKEGYFTEYIPPYEQDTYVGVQTANRDYDEIGFEAPPDEDDKVLVFVHGIHGPGIQDNSNIREGWYRTSETVFKRLWWQGYNGRFASYKWDALQPAIPFKFNESEYRGWCFGPRLAEFVKEISRSRKSLMAHSQGNTLCGYALAYSELTVENYLLFQAAVPGGCYDIRDNPINNYERFLDAEIIKGPTPDINTNLGYRGVLSSLSVTRRIVNFHNGVDYALATGSSFFGFAESNWEANQENYKPQTLIARSYQYDPNASGILPNDPIHKLIPTGSGSFVRPIEDGKESMAFLARPRSKAVGALGATRGSIQSDVSLRGSPYNFTNASSEHGGQFDRSIQGAWDVYTTLLEVVGDE